MLDNIKSKNPKSRRTAPEDTSKQPSSGGISISPKDEQMDVEFTGIDIKDFAKAHHMTVTEVWRKIQMGKILARSDKGKLLIYSDKPLGPKFRLERKSELGLPDLAINNHEMEEAIIKPSLERDQQLPSMQAQRDQGKLQQAENFSLEQSRKSVQKNEVFPENVSHSLMGSPEVALLLDHLSLAKEENKELLRMTRDSIDTVTKMSERIVNLKDEIIEGKNLQLQTYKSKLAEQEKFIKMLRQKNEDLEMLTRTMSESNK